MSIVTAANPVILYGVKAELNDSPRLTIDASGATIVHEYRVPAIVNPSLQTQDLPDPVAMLNAPFNLARGAYHWKRSLGGLYAQVRLSSFDWARAADHPMRATLKLTFSYNYPLTMNAYGETWRYSLATEMAEIKSVTTKSRRTTYGVESTGGETAYDTAIGVDGETVHGTQAYRPATALHVTKIWNGAPTQSYLDTISELRASVNTTPFPNTNEWGAREVLFLGAEVGQNADGYWQVDYSFLCAKRQGQQTIDLINGDSVQINPDPWEHVDYAYSSAYDAGDRKIRTAPVSVSVSQIYEIGNLDRLGLVGGIFA